MKIRDVPEQLVPRPRLIIVHGDIVDDAEIWALDRINQAYSSAIDNDRSTVAVTAGGGDWSAWHVADRRLMRKMHEVAATAAPPQWQVLLELA